MTQHIDYYFTPVSPWAFLGHARFVQLLRDTGASVSVRPVFSVLHTPIGPCVISHRPLVYSSTILSFDHLVVPCLLLRRDVTPIHLPSGHATMRIFLRPSTTTDLVEPIWNGPDVTYSVHPPSILHSHLGGPVGVCRWLDHDDDPGRHCRHDDHGPSCECFWVVGMSSSSSSMSCWVVWCGQTSN